MVHQFNTPGIAAARQMAPKAAIIRRIGPAEYIAFDRVDDAFGHRTAEPSK